MVAASQKGDMMTVKVSNQTVEGKIGGYSDVAVSPDGKQVYILYEEFSSQVSNLMFVNYRVEG